MTTRLQRFEVYRSNYPSSELGERFDDVHARDHRAAKQLAAQQHPGIQVVVLPARRPVGGDFLLPPGARAVPVRGSSRPAIVDEADYARVSRYSWRMAGGGRRYPTASIGNRSVGMHRLITGAPEGKVVDHADHDTLNNRRANLRVCSSSDNLANQRKPDVESSSAFKGVSWSRQRRKWKGKIVVRGAQLHLGYFESETDAARAYDAAALEHFGQFALVNFPHTRP